MKMKQKTFGACVLLAFAVQGVHAQDVNYTVTPIKVEATAKTVFPNIDKINPTYKEGVFIDVNKLLSIQKGMGKQEILGLVGSPHFQGNTPNHNEWNYLIKVATNPERTQFTKCQAQAHFAKSDELIDFLWNKPVCMALIQMKKPVETINLSSDFLFDFDKATLRPEAVNTLNQVANTVRGKPVRMTIQGFTDTYGTEQYNLGLSTQRANSVKNFLASQGINSPIDAVGMGEAEPVVNNCSPKVSAAGIACQASNRRVVIHVTQ
jgi:outer membrane protein OmpA-like peptidoglycan-associated protein